jgi:hypothetical protein
MIRIADELGSHTVELSGAERQLCVPTTVVDACLTSEDGNASAGRSSAIGVMTESGKLARRDADTTSPDCP